MTYNRVMNIVVSNVKGGVGKTTTSVYLAAAAVEQGYASVVLVDSDRQASSAEWFEDSPVEGVDLLEAPSERTVTRAMADSDSVVIVDTPPGDERIVKAALARADAVVIPTRAGGVEPTRVAATLDMVPDGIPYGIVVCAARLGTNDLTETVEGWTAEKVPVWGIIPERVGIASGPAARLYREGIDAYTSVLKRATRRRSR
jgi:chromosome partitioning protein